MNILLRLLLLSGCAAGAGVPALPALAQQTEARPAGSLQDIVVTARRREENLQDTPVSVTAFSGETLRAMNVQEVGRIANFTPGLELVPSGTTQGVAVAIRGIATYDPILTNEPSVSLYIDGVYVNALSYGQFDTLDLDRVEVLRGPQGTLFGRNTTGGAINIVTRRPSETFGVDGRLSYATHDEVVARARVDTGEIVPGWEASFTYQYRSRDGYVDNIGAPADRDPGASEAHAVRAALHGEIGERLALDYTFDLVRRRDVTPHNQFALVSEAYGEFFAQSAALGGDPLRWSPNRLSRVRQPMLPRARNNSENHALTLSYEASPELTLRSITGHRNWRSREIQPFGSSAGMRVPLLDFNEAGQPIGATVRTVDPYIGGGTKKLKQFTEEIQVLGTLPRFAYTLGGYYYTARYAEDNPQTYVFVLSPDAAVAGAGRLAYQGRTRSYALFGQASYTPDILDDGLEFTLGLRHTIDKKRVNTQVYPNGVPPALTSAQSETFRNTSYNITLNYKLAPDVSVYGRFGTGYRAGGFSPRGFDAPAYKPEKAKVYELGLKSEWLDRQLRANVSIYRTDYSDLQITQPGFSETAGFVSNTVNAGKAVYQGFEIELTAVPTAGLTFVADASYVDPEYKEFFYEGVNRKDDAKFGYVSKWSVHLGGRYDFPRMEVGQLSVALDYSFKSKRVFESLTSDPIVLPDARDKLGGGDREELSGRISLSEIAVGNGLVTAALFGDNLLNRFYRVSTIDFGALGFGTSVYNRPRVIGVELGVVF